MATAAAIIPTHADRRQTNHDGEVIQLPASSHCVSNGHSLTLQVFTLTQAPVKTTMTTTIVAGLHSMI